MDYRSSPIPRIRTIKALRGEAIKIDLGKEYSGTLTAWMKRDPNDLEYRSFDIIDNRYLYLTKAKASDYVEGGEVVSAIAGKWYFDVEQEIVGEDTKTVIYGTILFQNDITGSAGSEGVPPPDNNYRTINIELYIPSEESLSGTGVTQSDANKEFVTKINELDARSETITVENATVYEDTEVYDSGNVFVSYVNEAATNPIFQTAALYRSRKDTIAGVSPEDSLYDRDTNPTGKWEYQGASVTVTSGNTSNTIVADLLSLSALTEYDDTDSVFVVSENSWYKFYVNDDTGVQANDYDEVNNPGSWKLFYTIIAEATDVGEAIHNATEKITPVNADEFGIWDSVSEALRKVTWVNIKATLKTYFDTVYSTFSGSYNDLTDKPSIPTNNNELTNGAGYITDYTETDPVVGAINGIVKSDGVGNIGSVISGTDIKTINGSSALGSGNLEISGGTGGLASIAEPTNADIRAIVDYQADIDVINYSTNKLYEFDSTSTATDDDDTVLKPDAIASADPGRWLLKTDFRSSTTDITENTALPNIETVSGDTQATVNGNINERLFEQIVLSLTNYGSSITKSSQDITIAPYTFTAKKLAVHIDTAPTGSDAIVTFYKNGVSIGTVTVTASTNTGSTTITDESVSENDTMSAVVTQIGTTIPGTTAKAYIQGIKVQ